MSVMARVRWQGLSAWHQAEIVDFSGLTVCGATPKTCYPGNRSCSTSPTTLRNLNRSPRVLSGLKSLMMASAEVPICGQGRLRVILPDHESWRTLVWPQAVFQIPVAEKCRVGGCRDRVWLVCSVFDRLLADTASEPAVTRRAPTHPAGRVTVGCGTRAGLAGRFAPSAKVVLQRGRLSLGLQYSSPTATRTRRDLWLRAANDRGKLPVDSAATHRSDGTEDSRTTRHILITGMSGLIGGIMHQELQGDYELSSACSTHPLPEPWPMLTHASPPRPDGCSKIWGEALRRMYREKYGMSLICVRIGAVRPTDLLDEPRQYSV